MGETTHSQTEGVGDGIDGERSRLPLSLLFCRSPSCQRSPVGGTTWQITKHPSHVSPYSLCQGEATDRFLLERVSV